MPENDTFATEADMLERLRDTGTCTNNVIARGCLRLRCEAADKIERLGAIEQGVRDLLPRLAAYADDEEDSTVEERAVAATTHSVLSELIGLKSEVMLP